MRSATATTAEMLGKLNLKVVHGGDASLSSIKVMQPKQVLVTFEYKIIMQIVKQITHTFSSIQLLIYTRRSM